MKSTCPTTLPDFRPSSIPPRQIFMFAGYVNGAHGDIHPSTSLDYVVPEPFEFSRGPEALVFLEQVAVEFWLLVEPVGSPENDSSSNSLHFSNQMCTRSFVEMFEHFETCHDIEFFVSKWKGAVEIKTPHLGIQYVLFYELQIRFKYVHSQRPIIIAIDSG